jgi:hypothetical protein
MIEVQTMDENETRERSSPARVEGRSEVDLVDEPDQPRQGRYTSCMPREEKIRLIVLGLALLALLEGFLLFLFAGTVLPLFGTMVLAFLGYGRIDTWLDAAEPPR